MVDAIWLRNCRILRLDTAFSHAGAEAGQEAAGFERYE